MNIAAIRNKQQALNLLLVALIILENLFLHYFFKKGYLGQGLNSMGFFLTSFSFGFILLFKFYNRRLAEPTVTPIKKPGFNWVFMGALAAVFIYFALGVGKLIAAKPINVQDSDIIPLIQIMCKRLLSGQYVYAIVRDFGFDQEITYLPMHFLPYTIAETLHIDYRWISYTIWCFAILWMCIRAIKIQSQVTKTIIIALIAFSFYLVYTRNINIITITIELMVAGYYMMLMISMNTRSGWLKGIFIATCLLSRFSLVLWLPLYFYIHFISGNRKQLWISIGVSVALVLVIYVIPFLSHDWGQFYKSYKYYDRSSYFEWTHLNEANNLPYQLFQGVGFGYYFYTRFTNIDIQHRIKLLQTCHAVCCILSTVLMGAWFTFKRKKIDYRIFLLASFKIYFSIFLFLIQSPYEYLMMVSIFVSIAIFAEQARYIPEPENADNVVTYA